MPDTLKRGHQTRPTLDLGLWTLDFRQPPATFAPPPAASTTLHRSGEVNPRSPELSRQISPNREDHDNGQEQPKPEGLPQRLQPVPATGSFHQARRSQQEQQR